MNFLKLLFSSIHSVGTQIYAASIILNVKPNLREIKEIISILLAIFSVTILFIFIENFVRSIIIVCILMIVNWMIFEKIK